MPHTPGHIASHGDGSSDTYNRAMVKDRTRRQVSIRVIPWEIYGAKGGRHLASVKYLLQWPSPSSGRWTSGGSVRESDGEK